MRPSRPLAASTGRSTNRVPPPRTTGYAHPDKATYGQYDRARMRVRAANAPSAARPSSAMLAEREQRRLIERETALLLLRRDLSRWNLEKHHRELRVRELRCTRELQATLHAAGRAQHGAVGDGNKAAGGPSLRALHGQAIRATRRLSELEDEWTALRSSDPCVRAIDARLRVDELKLRCAELRAKLHTAEEQPPASEVATLEAQHADLTQQQEATDELDEMEGERERRRFEVLGKSVHMLDWQLERLGLSQKERAEAQRGEAAHNAHAHAFAAQLLQMELDAAQPLLLIAKSELGRLQQSDPAAAARDGTTAAQQKEELRQLEEEQTKQKAHEAKARQEVDALRQKLKDLEKAKDEREQKQKQQRRAAAAAAAAKTAPSSAAAAKAGASGGARATAGFTSDDQKRLDELRARLKVVDAVRATTAGKE